MCFLIIIEFYFKVLLKSLSTALPHQCVAEYKIKYRKVTSKLICVLSLSLLPSLTLHPVAEFGAQ